jgi:cyclophilin family peptidyl-prolyl cis-trans isomerase
MSRSSSVALRPLLLRRRQQQHSKQQQTLLLTTTLFHRRSFASAGGTRGSRGHGWLQKYRNNQGGRHLQGEHWDFPSLQEKMEWNQSVFDMNQNNNITMCYLDVQIQAGNTSISSTTEQQEIKNDGDISVATMDNDDSSSSDKSKTTRRLTMELATFATPVTSQNFTLLCQDKLYVNTMVDRMEKSVGWVMGSNMNPNNDDKNGSRTSGQHCHSSLSDTTTLFQDDPLVLWHIPGIVTMLSPHVNEIDSRFVLLTHESSHLDGRHVPFGRLTDESLQFLQSTSIFTKRGVPTSDVVVVDCGVVVTTTTANDEKKNDDDDAKEEQVA